MHSASSRFNGITLYTTMVLAAMCLLNFAHGYLLYSPSAQVALEVKAVTNFIDTKLWEQASFKYSLHADLSALYTWNLKQLYVFLEFQWTDPASQLKSSTIASDWILETPADKSRLKELWTISANETRMDYLVRDVHHGLRGNNVTISLNVEYMPVAGIFFNSRVFETTFTMPAEYSNASNK